MDDSFLGEVWIHMKRRFPVAVFGIVMGLIGIFLGSTNGDAQSGILRPIRIKLNNACTLRTGSGTPEGVVTGAICDSYWRTNGGTSTTFYVKESGSGNTGWIAYGGASPTFSDTEYWRAAICDQAGVYSPLWDTNATNNPTYSACWSGTNVQGASLTYLDTEIDYAWQHWLLPTDWTGALDARIEWRTTATTGNVVWQIQTACAATGGTMDPAWNTAQTVTTAAQGTANRRNITTFTGLTTTGCAAGNTFFFRLVRDPAHASDTIAASAEFIGLELKYRRTLL
jgi:hypothetical protein